MIRIKEIHAVITYRQRFDTELQPTLRVYEEVVDLPVEGRAQQEPVHCTTTGEDSVTDQVHAFQNRPFFHGDLPKEPGARRGVREARSVRHDFIGPTTFPDARADFTDTPSGSVESVGHFARFACSNTFSERRGGLVAEAARDGDEERQETWKREEDTHDLPDPKLKEQMQPEPGRKTTQPHY